MTDYHVVPTSPCPNCGRKLDAAQNADDGEARHPIEGDYSICLTCAAVLRFGPDLVLYEPKDEEIPEYVKGQQQLIINFNRSRNARYN